MLLSQFNYSLPPELIAQYPRDLRDASRMLLVRRAEKRWEHQHFRNLPEILKPGDLLVANDSRVIPSRLVTQRQGSRGRVEVLVLEQVDGDEWKVLLRPSRRIEVGDRLTIPGVEGFFEVKAKGSYGLCRLASRFSTDIHTLCRERGVTPLPPYIKRDGHSRENFDKERYQTIYASQDGSVAAPTAGLHFSGDVLQRLQQAGIEFCRLTLHVGLATFQPIRVARTEEHILSPENYLIPEKTADRINQAKSAGRRVVAVGTSTVRALESVVARNGDRVVSGKGLADLFIHPPYRFRIVDALLTNFHLPRSSLMVLVAAFLDPELILECYREAIREQYRFYSYGDCMLIV